MLYTVRQIAADDVVLEPEPIGEGGFSIVFNVEWRGADTRLESERAGPRGAGGAPAAFGGGAAAWRGGGAGAG